MAFPIIEKMQMSLTANARLCSSPVSFRRSAASRPCSSEGLPVPTAAALHLPPWLPEPGALMRNDQSQGVSHPGSLSWRSGGPDIGSLQPEACGSGRGPGQPALRFPAPPRARPASPKSQASPPQGVHGTHTADLECFHLEPESEISSHPLARTVRGGKAPASASGEEFKV